MSLKTISRQRLRRLLKYMADPYQADYTQLEIQEAVRARLLARFAKRKRK